MECTDFDVILEILNKIPYETKAAIEFFTTVLSEHISPVLGILKKKMEIFNLQESAVGNTLEVEKADCGDLSFLCHNLILKYVNLMVDIFKVETDNSCVLKESRDWALLRIIGCLEKMRDQKKLKSSAVMAPPDLCPEGGEGEEFITWVDDILDLQDVFTKLFQDDSDKLHLQNGELDNLRTWQNECISTIIKLHGVLREMVSAAMKLCQNCLPSDQSIIIARCHVVFRESKTLMGEFFNSDLPMDDGIDFRKVVLKKDLHYPTVRLLNDILRDAVYNLEASINRAILSLVLKCMVYPVEPLDKALREQLDRLSKPIANNIADDEDESEQFIDEFDIHNERLLQIGLFSVSCSADRKRISMLKSCLASLEALEPHLVPSFLSDPRSAHCRILANHWSDEINSLRALVFLIIDPIALIELVIEKYRSQMIEMKKDSALQWNSVQQLIGLGKSILDFIQIYSIHEPNSFPQLDKLSNLVIDLRKVLKECRVICELFLIKPDAENVNKIFPELSIQSNDQKNKEVRVLKRFKLLYALLLNISKEIIGDNSLNDEQSAGEDHLAEMENNDFNNTDNDCINVQKDLTRTIPIKLGSGQEKHRKVPQKNKGILGILENIKGNIWNGKHFGSITTEKETTHPYNAHAMNKTFSRSYIARKTPNFKKRNTSQQRISKLLEHQRKRSISTLIMNNEEFLLANISSQDQIVVTHHVAGLMQSLQFSDESSKGVIKMLNENSKITTKQRRSLRKQLLKNRVASNKLNNSVPYIPGEKATNLGETFNKNLSQLFDSHLKNYDSTVIDWHITEILEQLTGLSDTLSLLRIDKFEDSTSLQNITQPLEQSVIMIEDDIIVDQQKHVVILKINSPQLCSPKKVWNIKVNDTTSLDNSSGNKNANTTQLSNTITCDIDVSFGSNVPTPERMHDINLLEQKLADLRDFWKK